MRTTVNIDDELLDEARRLTGVTGRTELLHEAGAVLVHPFVIGELACGTLRNRAAILDLLEGLPAAAVATDAEVLHFIDERRLPGKGIGWVEAHLLASVTLTPEGRLWTRDRRLALIAEHFGSSYEP